MSQLIDLARVASNEAKQLAGGILASGCSGTQTENLAQAVANLCNAVDGICEHLQPLTEYQRALLDVIMSEPERLNGVLLNLPKNAGKAGYCPKCNTREGVHGGCDCGYLSANVPSTLGKTT